MPQKISTEKTKSKSRGTLIPDYTVSAFYGLNTEVKDIKTLPKGYSPESLNWITGDQNDHIELRRGSALLGQTRVAGNGKITGLGIGTKFNGTQVPFFAYGRKLKYYDEALDDTVEIGSDVLPLAQSGQFVSINPYQNLMGSWIYVSGKEMSTLKIPVANPGNAVDQSTTTYRGIMRFGQGRSFLMQRKGSNGVQDLLNPYLSYIDKDSLSDYTQVTGEAVGSSGSTHYTHILTAITGARTAGHVQVQATVAAGTETFTDNGDGVLTSNFGGTGTVNYATGAIDVTFSDVTTGAVTADYYWENATSAGVLDFSFSAPRTAGQGNFFLQTDGGGNLNAVFPLADIFFCLHQFRTWQLNLTEDDTAATNLPYREKMGVKYFLSSIAGAEGVYLIDSADPNKPQIRRLEFSTTVGSVNTTIPKVLSQLLDLANYSFDYGVVFEWGNYIIVACQGETDGVAHTYNSRFFVFNKEGKSWDLLDYPIAMLANFDGTLIGGDAISNNCFTLFSGFDDDEANIPNYWTGAEYNLDISGIKKVKRMVVQGLIQRNQKIKVYLAYDSGAFSEVFEIDGSASYVNQGQSTAIGTRTLGSKIIGGGGGVEYAHPFTVEFRVNSDLFEYVRPKFEATEIGFAQINLFTFKDVRYKGRRLIPSHTSSA